MGKKVVILGGGFGGITAAKAFKNTDYEVTLIDKTNHNLFLPLLFQVAAAAISPGDIAVPIRGLVKNINNVRVVLGEITRIDTEKKKVHTDQYSFDYDYLIVAIGAKASYFGHDDWAKYAISVRTLREALMIKDRMLYSFEHAEMIEDPKEIEKLTTFVVVGGGPIGVEISGALAEVTRRSMKRNFRRIDPAKTRIILLEAANKILPAFTDEMSLKALESLRKMKVDVRINTMVTGIDGKGVYTKNDLIETHNIIWCAGAYGHEVIKTMKTETDRSLRVLVENDFSIKDHPEVFVIGDACVMMDGGKPVPAVAPAATQAARYVARIIRKGIDKKDRKPFKYFNKGNLAVIGHSKAVLETRFLKLSGFPAWFLWLVVHLAVLIGGRSRYKVLAEWLWHYIARDYGFRVISQRIYNEFD